MGKGGIDCPEDHLEAAMRELKEETGIVSARIVHVVSLYTHVERRASLGSPDLFMSPQHFHSDLWPQCAFRFMAPKRRRALRKVRARTKHSPPTCVVLAESFCSLPPLPPKKRK